MNFYIIAHGRRKLAQLLPIQHINCSAAVFSFVWLSAGSEMVRWRIIIYVWAHMYVFMSGITAFMISSNDFSRGAHVHILWYSLGIFFWGLILLWRWVISSQRKCLMSHIWSWPIEAVKPHTLSYESRRDRFKSFLINVWDLLVTQSTVAFFVFILALLCVEDVVDKNGQIMLWKSPQMVRPLSLWMLGFPPPKWD